jgi:hypothetical protein
MHVPSTPSQPLQWNFLYHMATPLDNGPIHPGQPTSAEGVIVPVLHGLAEGVLYPRPISPSSDISLTKQASRAVIALSPHGLAKVIYTL